MTLFSFHDPINEMMATFIKSHKLNIITAACSFLKMQDERGHWTVMRLVTKVLLLRFLIRWINNFEFDCL